MSQGYLASLAALFDAVSCATPKDALMLEEGMATATSWLRGLTGAVYLVGNGGSASIASHLATDLWKRAGIRAWAFTDASLVTCSANDFGWPFVYAKPIERFGEPGDLLWAFSSSGRSENILWAVRAAEGKGMRVVTFSGFSPANPLRSSGDLRFFVPSTGYGPVEITHLAVGHGIVDAVVP